MVFATSQASDPPAHMHSLIRQSLCYLLEYSMSVKLLTERHLEFQVKKEAAQAPLSLHLSKYHIVGNHMSGIN